MYEQPFNPYAKNIFTVKEYFKSPAVLILGILRAVGALIPVAAAVLIATHLKELLTYFRELFVWVFETAGTPLVTAARFTGLYDQAAASISSASVISSAICTAVIGCLTAAAFLIIYRKSRSEDPSATPQGGVTILFAFAVIELIAVIVCLLGAVALIVLMVAVYAKMSAGSGELGFRFGLDALDDLLEYEMTPEALLVLIIVGAVLLIFAAVFLMIFGISKLRYYGSIRKSLSTVELKSEGAKPYGVMCIIGTVFSGLSLLSAPSSFAVGSSVKRPGVFTGILIVSCLSQAVSVAAYVLEAKLALGYKTHIDAIKYGYNRHAAYTAPYMAFNPGIDAMAPQNQPVNNPYLAPAPAPAPDNSADEISTDNSFGDPYGADLTVSDTEVPAEEPAPPQAAPICPVCGAEVDPDAPYCGNCGNKL